MTDDLCIVLTKACRGYLEVKYACSRLLADVTMLEITLGKATVMNSIEIYG